MATCEVKESDEADRIQSPVRVHISPKTYQYALYDDVHLSLPPPTSASETFYTRGHFSYFHYGCDGHQDLGWGCGYRTLQTAISWIINKQRTAADAHQEEANQYVPSIKEIQMMLVSIDDKSSQFVGSRDWIGTLEEFYVIDVMFQLPCKIVHAQNLNDDQVLGQIREYFVKYSGFIAMGGISDMASKGIAGWHRSEKGDVYLLIVDPHFAGIPSSKQQLIDQGYVRWMHINEFQASTYNLCFILQP